MNFIKKLLYSVMVVMIWLFVCALGLSTFSTDLSGVFFLIGTILIPYFIFKLPKADELNKSTNGVKSNEKNITSPELKETEIVDEATDDFIFDALKERVYGYHLALLTAIAYYGDGKISKDEMSFILERISFYMKMDAPDKKYKADLILLEILDSLHSALEEIKGKELRRRAAADIVVLFSRKINDAEQKRVKDDSLARKSFFGEYEKLTRIKNKKYRENILLKVKFMPVSKRLFWYF